MENPQNISALNRQNKILKILNLSMLVFVVIFAFIKPSKLSLIDSAGVKRMEMTTDLTTAPWGGEKMKRNVPPNMAGIIFLNPNGDEVGGIAFGGDENIKSSVNSLDYSGIPLEAIGFNRYQTDKSSGAQFVVMDNPEKDSGFDAQKFLEEFNNDPENSEQLKILQEQMVARINLGVENHNASLVLKDDKGNDRIVIEVNEKNEAVFKILNKKGDVVQRFPEL